jgi:cysteine desulfurase
VSAHRLPPEGAGASAPVVDCLGRPCPVPVIELARALPGIAVGGVLDVLSDDPAAALDIPAWCRMKQQEYVGARPLDGGTAHRVRRLT